MFWSLFEDSIKYKNKNKSKNITHIVITLFKKKICCLNKYAYNKEHKIKKKKKKEKKKKKKGAGWVGVYFTHENVVTMQTSLLYYVGYLHTCIAM